MLGLGEFVATADSEASDAESLLLFKEMIRKGNLLLSKAEPVRLEEPERLERLKAQSDELSRQGLAQRATLAEVEARLAQMANFNEAELRSQALVRAVNDKKTRLAFLEERIRSYDARS